MRRGRRFNSEWDLNESTKASSSRSSVPTILKTVNSSSGANSMRARGSPAGGRDCDCHMSEIVSVALEALAVARRARAEPPVGQEVVTEGLRAGQASRRPAQRPSAEQQNS